MVPWAEPLAMFVTTCLHRENYTRRRFFLSGYCTERSHLAVNLEKAFGAVKMVKTIE